MDAARPDRGWKMTWSIGRVWYIEFPRLVTRVDGSFELQPVSVGGSISGGQDQRHKPHRQQMST